MESAAPPTTSRALRAYTLACLAIAFGYVLVHVWEPLRLNLGDPASDANLVSLIKSGASASLHRPPLADLIYGAIGRTLGLGDLWAFRLIALAFSGLAMWALYQYARRMWTPTVALIATALFATNVLSLRFADGLQPPIAHAATFVALFGLVRAIESRRRLHYATVILATAVCFLTSYDYWLFLPVAMLVTVRNREPGNLRLVTICAAGCLAFVVWKLLLVNGSAGWHDLVDRKFAAPFATLVRRYTAVFTPLFWVTLGYTIWRAARAPSVIAAFADGALWILVAGAGFVLGFARHTGSPLQEATPLLVFWAIGSALLIARLLAGTRLTRGLAIGWIAIAPAWSAYLVLTQPRAVLDPGDVAKVNAYLAANDRNDFVMSNLLSDSIIEAAFDRHTWASPSADPEGAIARFEEIFEATGTDTIHAVIFTTPDSRFVDRTLAVIVRRRPLYSVTGWPELTRAKADQVIGDYDRHVLANLDQVRAKRVLELGNFVVYRIDRAALIEAAGRAVPEVRSIDFGSVASKPFKLLGWSEARTIDGIGFSRLDGFGACPDPAIERPGEPTGNACETASMRNGLDVIDSGIGDRAQLLIRVERACDLRLTLVLVRPEILRVAVGDFTTAQCALGTHATFEIPQRVVHTGLNVITFQRRSGPDVDNADVTSLAIDPICKP